MMKPNKGHLQIMDKLVQELLSVVSFIGRFHHSMGVAYR